MAPEYPQDIQVSEEESEIGRKSQVANSLFPDPPFLCRNQRRHLLRISIIKGNNTGKADWIAADAAMLMTAHVAYPTLDPEPNVPATLSKPILTDLLRGRMGYRAGW